MTDSLAQAAYRQLKEQIATGRLVAGQRLAERDLAARMGMSPTPVREALRRLEAEGLTTKTGPKTVTVAEHSAGTLAELQYAYITLRAAAARFAAGKATRAQVERLRASASVLQETARGGDSEAILGAATDFDNLIAAISGNPLLNRMVSSAEVVTRDQRLRAIAVMTRSRQEIGRDRLRAHLDLVEAIAAGDGVRAEAVVLAHLRSSTGLLLSDLDHPSDP